MNAKSQYIKCVNCTQIYKLKKSLNNIIADFGEPEKSHPKMYIEE